MHSSSTGIRSFRFSTAGVPPRERSATLHSLRESGILPIEPLPDLQPHVAIEKRFLPGAAIMSGAFSGVRQGGHAGDDIFFGVNLTGESTARQGGRELNLRSGDALFFVGAESDIASRVRRPCAWLVCACRLRQWRRLSPTLATPERAWRRASQGPSNFSPGIFRPSRWAPL